MGLLSKWFKKKQGEQLKAVSGTSLELEKLQKIVKEKSPAPKSIVAKTTSTHAYRTIVRPRISEKAGIAESRGTYTFVVAGDATKTQIKRSIHELYGVMPSHVATMWMEGKWVRFGYRLGRRTDWKKAIVSLPKGQTIDIHEGV